MKKLVSIMKKLVFILKQLVFSSEQGIDFKNWFFFSQKLVSFIFIVSSKTEIILMKSNKLSE